MAAILKAVLSPPHRLSVGSAEGLVAVGAVLSPSASAGPVHAVAAEAARHVLAAI